MTDDEVKVIKETILAELAYLKADVARCKEERDTAKTTVKRQYFDKKLKKANDEVIRRVVALQRLEDRDKALVRQQIESAVNQPAAT